MQLTFQFGPIVNSEFLSNHWLDHRLPLEPEWGELRKAAAEAAGKLITLWTREKTRVERYGDEAGLEEKFIQPVFEILGWSLKYQAYLQGREPDYALFTTDDKLNDAITAGRGNPDFWLHASLVADAKAWHVSLDRPQRVGSRREYPPEQIEWYLDRSRVNFGILTNGRLWRLVPRDIERSRPRFQTYLEVDLPALIDRIAAPETQLQFGIHGPELDLFLRFFLLFSVHGFAPAGARVPLIRRAVEGSSEHALGVSEELKERVFEALRLSIEGFIAHPPNELNPDSDLAVCQSQGLVFLYRLLFILYAEDRGLLPYQKNDIYTRNRSLSRFRAEVAAKLDMIKRGIDRVGYSRTATTLWNELKSLFDIVDSGHARYEVPSYNGGLFNPDEHPFLETKSLPDCYVAPILDQLSRAPHRDRPELGLFRVDYRDLAIQQLGSVYEGLLELRPRYARQDMIVIRSRGAGDRTERIISALAPVAPGFERTAIVYRSGSIYLETDKGERRAFGTYYTPDHIVNHMVNASLGEACRAIEQNIKTATERLNGEIAANSENETEALRSRRDAVAASFADRVLTLRVLDPAMGSGHFLIRICQYLAEEIATNPYTSEAEAEDIPQNEASIIYWKRRVAESCLYGVDINPMAVELAKLALWLETVAIDAPLAFLNHHLQAGDSLIGARIDRLDSLPGKALISGTFKQEISAGLPSLLGPLQEIRQLPSSSLAQVKRKEQLFKRRFRTAQERFQTVADIWCATAIGALSEEVSPVDYAGVIQTLVERRRVNSKPEHHLITEAHTALNALEMRCFHWELAFPEVFLGANGRRGFDIVIGNPPYDVLAERESGPRVSYLKRFIAHDQSLAPSVVGKNNSYKLFICRAVELIRRGGYVTFIVPMALLGDEQARGIRQMLLREGAFSQIHSFPQKDDPAQRVFRDAKLATALFVFHKETAGEEESQPFPSVRHRANTIDSDSPSLSVQTLEIPLYNPTNATIVSCSQDDWDLAVRIAQRPGIRRLGAVCKSYQGEVNETTDKAYVRGLQAQGQSLVLRGANICMYVLREASQGVSLYLDMHAYQTAKASSEKAFHTRVDRVGFQRSAPQNNYRRVIAAHIPAGEFCFDTVSYIPRGPLTLIDLDLLLALLNSKLTDWYFTIGSTNSKVNEYQFNNLPCPAFRSRTADDQALLDDLLSELYHHPADILPVLEPYLEEAPFNPAIEQLLIALSRRVRKIEENRGAINRVERAHLAAAAQPYQDTIDAILFRLVGFSRRETDALTERLDRMA
jgi:Eco57I restriction-modification methylase